jgi:hypothetical protein
MVNEILNKGAFADKIAKAYQTIPNTPTVFLTSKEDYEYSDPYWKAGKTVEVSYAAAGRLIVNRQYRVATDQEMQAFLDERAQRTTEIRKSERNKKQTSVLEFSDDQMAVLQSVMNAGAAQERDKSRKGDKGKGE